MVASEAPRRNFNNAVLRVFLRDGAAWLWKLKHQYFANFQAIVDFLAFWVTYLNRPKLQKQNPRNAGDCSRRGPKPAGGDRLTE